LAKPRKARASERAYKLAVAKLRAAGPDGQAHAEDVEACKSLAEFTRQAWHSIEPGTPYLANWHIDAICEHLEAVTAGQIKRLLINMPPRYMKSLTCSVMWPVWEWTQKPETRYMFTTYSGDLSKDHALSRRTILESEWFRERWGHKVRLISDNITSVVNDRRGVFTATSFTGSATGKGANRLVVDDPHNPKKAESDVERVTTVRLFNTTFMNRLNNKFDDAILAVMQRLHEEDVSARCIEQGYTHLCLPAESEGRTTIVFPMSGRTVVREDGDILWPEREGPEQLQEQKDQGSYYYAGQYQQRPAPAGGGMFTSFEVVDAVPHNLILCRGWDKAGSEGKGDYSAGAWLGMTPASPPEFFILDITRGQWSAGNREKVMHDTATADGNETIIWIEQEGGSGGKDSADVSIRNLAGFQAYKQVASGTGDKVARARPLAAQAEIGNVKLLRGPWNKDFIDEARIFPNGKHDDQIDAASLAFNKLCLMPRPGKAAGAQTADAPPVPRVAGAAPVKPAGWSMGR
jgi:predicted phage terminase large subunit-like protein